jgi:hypothetical protein
MQCSASQRSHATIAAGLFQRRVVDRLSRFPYFERKTETSSASEARLTDLHCGPEMDRIRRSL